MSQCSAREVWRVARRIQYESAGSGRSQGISQPETLETQIAVELCLDGTGQLTLDTGLPFLEHMLDQIARHGQVDLDIKAKGDLHIDTPHGGGYWHHSRAGV